MLDAMSMDQLRTFIAAAEEGSFSAAGRKLRRAQSVVSQTLANLELQVGFALFDRGGACRIKQGASSSMDGFKAKARTLAEGLEAELAVAVDVMFPIARLTEAVRAFHHEFPGTPLRFSPWPPRPRRRRSSSRSSAVRSTIRTPSAPSWV